MRIKKMKGKKTVEEVINVRNKIYAYYTSFFRS